MKKVLTLLLRHWIFFSFVAVILFLIAFYLLGFRVGPGPSIVQVGTVILIDVPERTEIYVDSTRQTVIGGGSGRVSITPGTHTLLASVQGYFPWNELVTIGSGETITIRPFFSPTNISGERLIEEDVASAKKAIAAVALPTKAEPLLMKDGCVAVYVLQNRVVAENIEGCEPLPYLCVEDTCAPTVVFPPADRLRGVTAFPGRDDALLISSGRLVHILELDPRAPRFFAPLYDRGEAPKAIPWTENSILVEDGETVLELFVS